MNMTQAEFGQLVGISGNYLSDIESGKRKPPLDLIEFVIDKYDVSPNELFGYDEIEPKNIKDLVQEEVEKILREKYSDKIWLLK